MSDFYEGVCVGAIGLLALSFATLFALCASALANDRQHRPSRPQFLIGKR